MNSQQRDPRLAWIGATDAYQTSTQPVRLTIIITYTRPK